MGKLLIVIGLVVVILGVILTFAPGLLGWFGKLPGDIRVQGEKGGFFFPITSMIIVSVVLSLVLNLLGRH
ncbi:MAG: DUF2905 domain-containing protein [Pseudomonadota bacterium]|nr:hypothetical protein [Pseudomonadales bacterium]MDY6918736.1 DUF2905 domain-containing protein [Pseudomonadota bacterium]